MKIEELNEILQSFKDDLDDSGLSRSRWYRYSFYIQISDTLYLNIGI